MVIRLSKRKKEGHSFDSLPDGVVELIMDQLPLAADRKAVRRLCRRTRALVDTKVTKITVNEDIEHDLEAMLSRFPRLDSVMMWFLSSLDPRPLARARL